MNELPPCAMYMTLSVSVIQGQIHIFEFLMIKQLLIHLGSIKWIHMDTADEWRYEKNLWV